MGWLIPLRSAPLLQNPARVSFAYLVFSVRMFHLAPARLRAQKFPSATSFRICFSKDSSATKRLSLPAERVAVVRAATQITEAQRPRGTVQPHPQRGILRSPGGVRPGAHAEPPTAGLGENLQLCAPASIVGLPHPTRVHHPMETQPQKGKVSLIYWTSTQP
jgi:hypothetical protein